MQLILPIIVIIVGVFKYGVGGVLEKFFMACIIIITVVYTWVAIKWVFKKIFNLFRRA